MAPSAGGGAAGAGRRSGERRRRGRLSAWLAPVLGPLAALWVARRRARYRDRAGPLPEPVRTAVAAFFPPATLDAARLAAVPRIPGPPFLSLLRKAGLVAADFRRVVGMTFADTMIVTEDLTGPELHATLFHELVHVEQARQLGLRGFARRYVEGWLEGRRYDRIPLERDAYELQRRFEAPGAEPFDVAGEVARRLAGQGASVSPRTS